MLELRQLAKTYVSGGGELLTVLDGISMSVQAGELVTLYGPSGSGKSTLLNIVAAIMPPDSGTVLIDGRDTAAFDDQEASRYRKRYLGYISQSLDLIPGISAIENATLKLIGVCSTREARRRVTPIMERLGLAERLRNHPDQLSAGERQRVLLARALATDPRLILADEPTGNLDLQRSQEVLALLASLCDERGVAMLLVTHDPTAAAFASTVHELRNGQLAAYRPHSNGAAAPRRS